MTITYILQTREGHETFYAANDEAARKLAQGAAQTLGWSRVDSAQGRFLGRYERID